MMPKIIAQGGFNTGRLYTAAGQRIFWTHYSDGQVFFRDRDRMIEGWMDRLDPVPGGGHGLATGGSPGFARWLMNRYDANRYELAAPDYRIPPRTPKDIDFGPALKI